MDTENDFERQILRQVAHNQLLRSELEDMGREMQTLRGSLERMVERVSRVAPAGKTRYTGWMACFKASAGAWSCVLCFNANEMPEELPDFDIILPIPRPESLQEWEGP